MGSIRDAASTSSTSSSCHGDSPSTSKTKTHQSPSVADLRRRFEGLQPKVVDERSATGATNRRGGSGRGTFESSEIVYERKSKRPSTSARPAAVSRSAAIRRSLGAGSTQLPVNRGRPVIPVYKRSEDRRLNTARGDQGNLDFTVSVNQSINQSVKVFNVLSTQNTMDPDFMSTSRCMPRSEALLPLTGWWYSCMLHRVSHDT